MVSVTRIFGGPFTLPNNMPENNKTVEEQLIDAIREAKLNPPDQVFIDGKIHRFDSCEDSKKTGWYVVYSDGVPAGKFGCWKKGVDQKFIANIGRKLTDAEKMACSNRMIEAKAARDAEMQKKHEITASTVEKIWSEAPAANEDHIYLTRKGIKPNGARITGDGRLIVPLYDKDGKISSLQYISNDGSKLYHSGGQVGGCFWMLGTLDEAGKVYVAEGFATAATIYETTGRPCVVAYSASNLVHVCEIITGNSGFNKDIVEDIIVVADNDKSGVGQRYAEQACAKFGVKMVMPPVLGDANDYAKQGGDLNELLNPKKENWLTPADDFCSQPAPIAWLVENWIQDDALIMVHGPSGGGKTFVVLDWCMTIASQYNNWMGNEAESGPIIYLAGEGHHGLRSRIAAWKEEKNVRKLNMWLSKSGCDLNLTEGYLKVLEQIRDIEVKPSLIVVDTLHRFLNGDENSAKDAKTMLDACAKLMQEFDCSVLLVHHTGVNDDSQHRARGSSAWRGALDIEISVKPATKTRPIEIVQRKSKDSEMAEPVYVELKQVEIPGWKDKKGKPVTSAVIIEAEKPVEQKKESAISGHIKTLESAWWATGCEIEEELPYVSRQGMIRFLITNHGVAESTAKKYVKPSLTNNLIGSLLTSEIIKAHSNGWVITDSVTSSVLIMRKNGQSND